MQRTRKTKNRYQMNIAIYTKRLEKATSEKVKRRLKFRIMNFKSVIRNIEKRERTIKRLEDIVFEYYDIKIKMRELLMMNFNNPNKELYVARCMFFKLCKQHGIDSVMIYHCYHITGTSKDTFADKKVRGIKRANTHLKTEWLQFRNYLKQTA